MRFEWIDRGYVREIGAAAAIVAVGVGWRLLTGSLEAEATPPRAAAAAPAVTPGSKPVAIVNGVEITSDHLAGGVAPGCQR